MGKKIKTYGEIQYYLYDGDKKEKKVSKDSFMNSKDVAVKHNTPKPEQAHTKSQTGVVIESFEEFCNEYNGPNLQLNYNTDYDFKSYQGTSFDGGDGPSGTELPEPSKEVATKVKIDRGHKENKERKRKNKKMSKEYRNAKMMKNYQLDDDLVKFAPRTSPTTNAGGAT